MLDNPIVGRPELAPALATASVPFEKQLGRFLR